jgi:hypothetical protein
MSLKLNCQYTNSSSSAKIVQFLHPNTRAALAKKVHDHVKDALSHTDLPPVDHLILVQGSQDALEKYHYTRALSHNNVDGLDFHQAFRHGAGHRKNFLEVLCKFP